MPIVPDGQWHKLMAGCDLFLDGSMRHLTLGDSWSISGWWLSPTPLKNDGVKVSWDDDIPNMMEK